MSLKIAVPGFAAIAIGKIHRERFTESQNDQRNNSMMDAEHIRYIRLYDLITRMRTALDDYIAFHKKPTMSRKSNYQRRGLSKAQTDDSK